MRRRALVWLCIALVVIQSGCATAPPDPPYPRDEDRARMRSVGIVVIQKPPEVDLRDFPVKGEIAAKGAAAALGFAAIMAGALACGVCVPLGVPWAATAYGGLAIEAMAATAGDPAKTIEAARAEIETMLARSHFQETFGNQILEYARNSSVPGVAAISGAGPAAFEDRPSYLPLPGQDVDLLLEVAVLKLKLIGTGIVDTRYALEMTARARHVRASDGTVAADHTYFYCSETRTLDEWTQDEGRPFRRTLAKAIQMLAEYVIDEALLLAGPSVLMSTPGQPRPPRFWYSLYPEYPQISYVFGERGPHGKGNTRGGTLFTMVDSLQPTLRWENFFERAGETGGRDVVSSMPAYELRLFNAEEVTTFELNFSLLSTSYPKFWVPGELIYSRSGITTPYFRLESALAPCTNYFWTVRARWGRNGRSLATEWASLSIFSPWRLRRVPELGSSYSPLGLRFSPQSYYLPFATPCETTGK